MQMRKTRRMVKKRFQDTIKYLEKHELSALFKQVDDERDGLLIRLLYNTGCRVSEMCLMRVEHIDFENGFIRIPAENTKTKQSRTVWVKKELLAELDDYLEKKGVSEGFVFTARGGRRLSSRRVQQLVHEYAVEAGIQRVYAHDERGRPLYSVTPHTLRHTHIVDALLRKVPMSIVQKQVGHKRLTTTQIYSDVAPKLVKEAYEDSGF